MKPTINLLIAVIFTAGFLFSCGNKNSEDDQQQKQGRQLEIATEVTFINNTGDEISTIRAAVADEQQERNQGLMDVNEIPADVGMLFIFPEEEELSFYMANTPLPLDIMFVNKDSLIVRIHHNTTPFSNEQLLSEKPAKFVVETNAGYAVTHDIQEGMKIKF